MHITLIHASIGQRGGAGGGARLMLELASALDRLGHEITVVSHDCDPGNELLQSGVQFEVRAVKRGVVPEGTGKRAAFHGFWRAMPRVAQLVPPHTDVINAHEWPALHAARVAGDRLACPFVWTRNDHTIFERAVLPTHRNNASTRFLHRLPRFVGSLPDFFDARRAAAIVTLDEESRRMAERTYRRPVVTVRCGPADRFFDPPPREVARAELGLSSGTFLVLGVGIMNPHRRFEDLVDATAELRDAPNLEVRIVGSDQVDREYADFIEAMIRDRGLTGRVNLLRAGVSEGELRALYVAADLFVFPNDHRQSWGLAPLEALASGTPVVVTDGAGVAEVLRARAGVTVVPQHSASDIARAISAHIDGDRRASVEETRRWLRDELSTQAYASRMVQICDSVVAHGDVSRLAAASA